MKSQIHFHVVSRLHSVLSVPKISESFSVLLLAMADVRELHLVPNPGGNMALAFEGRAYKLKHTGKQ
ncbi:hypothetical protein T4B_1744 [Trichinella pseudospiralis]|uniref:Uncharacterized protein n=1 Tax=Trichinella pseudospiralis TaxID=6337 RepID=A0A0V0YI64_TRIPS|nr:hypothetical protein T4E_10495 [Trichinella pseudospiralis]KRY77518.1 hypothetical protein T4A_10273 [Trichinella pseudospiralis]KRZ31918.1 hypothetical protein T4B_1744 [Trichinella pseudospiralis]KRZ44580.1 hypothetical protein T4C_12307 [Trichinella pseudospiralis]